MEKEKNYLKDRRPESKPIEEIEAANTKLIETARTQLEQIKVSLKDLCKRIIDEKPDMVVFLDKGARVLAAPITEFLRSKMKHVPEIRFYNDDKLKGGYLTSLKVFWEVIENDFEPHKNKKVFFIDETFSGGKGAAALYAAILDTELDGYYFALTKDPDPQDQDDEDWDDHNRISYRQVQDSMEQMRQDGRLMVYDNNIGYLFTKDAAKLYVIDSGVGETGSRYEIIPDDKIDDEYDYSPKPGEIPHGRAYMDEYADRDWKEYDRQVRLSNRKTIDELRDLISKALVDGDE